ncbi:hypothetical protein C7M84_004097 [Penaeus vannamei]|uniref:Uncharacterized protein n=1 Tax=Penaeus vannamei TaxID=6689 RepID=A0A423TLE9_PENVA|nr:hypothetical protein C7M84_004097 [Penaeus vannamei]
MHMRRKCRTLLARLAAGHSPRARRGANSTLGARRRCLRASNCRAAAPPWCHPRRDSVKDDTWESFRQRTAMGLIWWEGEDEERRTKGMEGGRKKKEVERTVRPLATETGYERRVIVVVQWLASSQSLRAAVASDNLSLSRQGISNVFDSSSHSSSLPLHSIVLPLSHSLVPPSPFTSSFLPLHSPSSLPLHSLVPPSPFTRPSLSHYSSLLYIHRSLPPPPSSLTRPPSPFHSSLLPFTLVLLSISLRPPPPFTARPSYSIHSSSLCITRPSSLHSLSSSPFISSPPSPFHFVHSLSIHSSSLSIHSSSLSIHFVPPLSGFSRRPPSPCNSLRLCYSCTRLPPSQFTLLPSSHSLVSSLIHATRPSLHSFASLTSLHSRRPSLSIHNCRVPLPSPFFTLNVLPSLSHHHVVPSPPVHFGPLLSISHRFSSLSIALSSPPLLHSTSCPRLLIFTAGSRPSSHSHPSLPCSIALGPSSPFIVPSCSIHDSLPPSGHSAPRPSLIHIHLVTLLLHSLVPPSLHITSSIILPLHSLVPSLSIHIVLPLHSLVPPSPFTRPSLSIHSSLPLHSSSSPPFSLSPPPSPFSSVLPSPHVSCGMQTDAAEIACTRVSIEAGVGKHGEVAECCRGCRRCQTGAGMTGDRCRWSAFD